jgi:hypothetical protein
MAAEVMPPNNSAAAATIQNSIERSAPSQATANQPPSAATIMRAVPASTGHRTRLAPWLAK